MIDSVDKTDCLPPRPNPRSGVTLIDLLITVLIVGVMAAVALPKFNSVYDSLTTEAAARRIAADLNYARRTAMLTSRNTTVTFDTLNESYSMQHVPHPHRPGQSYSVNLAQVAEGVQLITANFNQTDRVSFNAYGSPLVGAAPLQTSNIRVGMGDSLRHIAINLITGEATVL